MTCYPWMSVLSVTLLCPTLALSQVSRDSKHFSMNGSAVMGIDDIFQVVEHWWDMSGASFAVMHLSISTGVGRF